MSIFIVLFFTKITYQTFGMFYNFQIKKKLKT